ncbi:sigma-70 family RNA polymerase sigma factor [Vagococcus elongatus]|nr:sigma-70 family RNA polymerase sigma factor [Vagococcus elongatus]
MKNKDRQLIIAAKHGDIEAFEQIFKKYQPIIFKLQKEYYLRGYDYDDWLQEGQIVCYNSIKSYDLDKGLSFGYFFKMNFQRHIFSVIRRQNALKRRVDVQSVSLEGKIAQGGDFFTVKEDNDALVALDYVLIRDQLQTFDTQLSDFERLVFHHYVKGKSKENISEELNCSLGKVRNALDRVKRKLREHINC